MGFFASNNDGKPYINWGSDAVQWRKGKDVFVPVQAIFDMENYMWGYMAIQQGSVDKVLVHNSSAPPARPAGTKKNLQGKDVPLYDKAFAVNVLFGKEFGTERLYEWSSTQLGSVKAFEKLLADFEAGKAANPSKVPVVQFGPHVHEKIGKGSTNIPGLKITSWIDRPADLPQYDPKAPAASHSQSAPEAPRVASGEF